MKKNYVTPENEVVCLCGDMGLCSVSGDIAGPGTGGGTTDKYLSKERTEDEEAYIATGGAGAADYGDLW